LERIGTSRYGLIARLSGHDFRFHKIGRDGSGKADASATGESVDFVWGVLVELDGEEMATLDRFEPGYDRSLVEVAVPGQEDWCAVHTYLARPAAVDPSKLPFSWYRQLIVAGGTARGLPEEYLAGIAAMPARADERTQTGPGIC
jgi:hypothetical protein